MPTKIDAAAICANPQFQKDLRSKNFTYDYLRKTYKCDLTNTEIRAIRDALQAGRKLPVPSVREPSEDDRLDALRAYLRKNRRKTSVMELCDHLQTHPAQVRALITSLQGERVMARIENDNVELRDSPEKGEGTSIDSRLFFGKTIRFGAISDTHLCSRYSRLDVLHSIYDIFEKAKINTVYHGGNFVDGEARFNQNDLLVHGMDRQLQYFVDKYPQRKGITTHFIAGDDHEGWWVQREGIDVGERTQDLAERAGRRDLKYLGYMEHDIELRAEEGSSSLRVVHAGGGTSYALSYQPQKIIESLSGGEKPSILLIGHYHKADYMYYRNIHCLQLGTTCDQTPFMRKKRLAAHVGAWIVEANQAPDGSINRFKVEFINFFDQDYYRKWSYQK